MLNDDIEIVKQEFKKLYEKLNIHSYNSYIIICSIKNKDFLIQVISDYNNIYVIGYNDVDDDIIYLIPNYSLNNIILNHT